MPTPAHPAAEDRSPAGCDVLVIRCDVLVIGAGPAGLATAIRLRTSTPLEVVVAEARTSPAERFGETLAPGALAALGGLGLADAFRADGHLPCPGGISAWGRDRPGHNDHLLDPLGPAWHIDRRVFEAHLRTRAAEVGAEVRPGTRAITTRSVGEKTQVLLRDGSGAVLVVQTTWVVDASGSSSWFARRHGVRRRRCDRLVAVLGFAELESGSLTAQTIVEATPTGWWYGSRLPGTRVVTALVTEPYAAAALLALDGRGWYGQRAATALLGPMLARCRLRDEPLRCRPVAVSVLDRPAGPGWLAVGDAACERDPITGCGIHDALLDAGDAAWTIAAATRHRAAPPWTYQSRVRSRFAAHLRERAALYASERRWPAEAFWSARLAAAERIAEC